MNQKTNHRMAILLFVIWIISVFVVYIGSGIEWFSSQFFGIVPSDSHSFDDIILIAIDIFYFIPMLALISRYSQLANMRRLHMTAQVLISILSIIACVAGISFFIHGFS